MIEMHSTDGRGDAGSGARHTVRAGAPVALRFLAALALLALAAAMPALISGDATPTTALPYRVYLPIIIMENAPPQPITLTFQQGSNGYSGVTDTFISSYGDPYAPHGFEPILAVRWQRSAQSSDAEATFLQYDLSAIPTAARIESATLDLYVTGRTNFNSMTLSAYGVLRPWQATQANWYSATQASAWFAPGCNGINSDRLGLATDSVDIAGTGMWVHFTLTSLVQGWAHDPAGNFGLVLKPVGTSSTPSVRYELAGSLHPDPGLRPRLTVTYILLPTPQPTPTAATATPSATASPTASVPSATATRTATPTATWTPSPSWWDTGYAYRRRLTIHTAENSGVAAGYAVSLTLDSNALIVEGKLNADRSDWRVVAWNGVTWIEIGRDVVGPGETWFALLRAVAANSSDDYYYVYYGNPNEVTTARAAKDRVYTFYDDFDSYDASKWPALVPTGVEVGGGVLTVTATSLTGGPADSCPGAYDCMLSRQTFGLGYQVEQRTVHPDYVYGKKHDADQGFSDDGHTN